MTQRATNDNMNGAKTNGTRRSNGARRSSETTPLQEFLEELKTSDDWFDTLLRAIANWEAPEEEVAGRRYQYLIGGEAFDWLLLAERLCNAANGRIPIAEKEELLFFGRPPHRMDDDEFRHRIGNSKHRAHLNFLYGVAVEEALQWNVEEDVLKSWRALGGWNRGQTLDGQVFDRLYNRGRDELLVAFRAGSMPTQQAEPLDAPLDIEISYGELRAFTYWLFKYRVSQSDPARVASDTRKALAQLSELEAVSKRRARYSAMPRADRLVVIDGEVVPAAR